MYSVYYVPLVMTVVPVDIISDHIMTLLMVTTVMMNKIIV